LGIGFGFDIVTFGMLFLNISLTQMIEECV
jgi:hypothetical protein